MKTRILLAVLAVAAMVLMSQPSPREQVGPMADGGFLLSSGWRIKAAGTQIPVETFPMASVTTPDKKYLLVLNGGYNPPTISVIGSRVGGASAIRRVARAGISSPPKSTSRLSAKCRKNVRSVRPARAAISATVVCSNPRSL